MRGFRASQVAQKAWGRAWDVLKINSGRNDTRNDGATPDARIVLLRRRVAHELGKESDEMAALTEATNIYPNDPGLTKAYAQYKRREDRKYFPQGDPILRMTTEHFIFQPHQIVLKRPPSCSNRLMRSARPSGLDPHGFL